MSHVFHRSLNQGYPTAVKGDGPYLIDSQGRRYLDASGGAAVSCLGHSDAQVIEAIQQQVSTLAYAHTSFFTCTRRFEVGVLRLRRLRSHRSGVETG